MKTRLQDILREIAENQDCNCNKENIKEVGPSNDGERAAIAADRSSDFNRLKANIDTDVEFVSFLKAELPQLKVLQMASEKNMLPRYAEMARQFILKMAPATPIKK